MLKPYIGFSRFSGPQEGASLIFASNAREAKRIGWRYAYGKLADEYIEFAVRLLRDKPWIMEYADSAKRAAEKPHVVDDPPVCIYCETWGSSPLVDGLCKQCREDIEDTKHVGS